MLSLITPPPLHPSFPTSPHAPHQYSGLFADEPGGAPDVVVDAVGMHYATSLLHRAMAALSVESDTPEIVNTCLRAVRKGGRVSLAGAYAGVAHGFHLGALMEKQLQLRGGQTPVQRTWRMLRDKVLEGALDPTIVVTHRLPLEEVRVYACSCVCVCVRLCGGAFVWRIASAPARSLIACLSLSPQQHANTQNQQRAMMR